MRAQHPQDGAGASDFASLPPLLRMPSLAVIKEEFTYICQLGITVPF